MDPLLKEVEETKRAKRGERGKRNPKGARFIKGCIISKHVQHFLKENEIKVWDSYRRSVWSEIVLTGSKKERIYFFGLPKLKKDRDNMVFLSFTLEK